MKAWATVAVDAPLNARPTSILLTVLGTAAFKHIFFIDRMRGVADDDALVEVVQRICPPLLGDKRVQHPTTDEGEHLNRTSVDAWDQFFARLKQLVDIVERSCAPSDDATAAVIWSEVLPFFMSLPEAEELEVVDGDSGLALMVRPEIEVQLLQRDANERLATHHNEVPGVILDRHLTFTITNRRLVPQYATLEWTVSNA